MKRRCFLQSVAAACVVGTLKPSYIFAQSSPGRIKNLVHIFLYGGADPRHMFPYLSGPLHDKLKELRPNTYASVAGLTHAGQNQSGRVNPVGYHPSWKPLLDTVTATGTGLGLVTEYGITSNISFSHEVSQKYFQAGTSKNVTLVQQGWLGKLIDTAQLPFLTAWVIGSNDSFLANAHLGQPMILSTLDNFNVMNRMGGDFTCATTHCPQDSKGDKVSDATDDSAFGKSIAERLLQEKRSELPLDEGFKATLSGMYQTAPIIQKAATFPRTSSLFVPAGQGTGGIPQSMMDISRAIQLTNSTDVSESVRNSSKIFSTGFGGWDAHTNVNSSYQRQITTLATALSGFVQTLASQGSLDDTVILVQTEFGRTTRENGSGGYDHAGASYCMMIGDLVRKQIHGPDASADEAIKQNYFMPQVAFTSIMKGLLGDAGFSSDVLNRVFSDSMPGEVSLPLLV